LGGKGEGNQQGPVSPDRREKGGETRDSISLPCFSKKVYRRKKSGGRGGGFHSFSVHCGRERTEIMGKNGRKSIGIRSF